jgi:hypothetical protein
MNVALELSKLETTESNIWQSYDPVLLTGVILPQYLKQVDSSSSSSSSSSSIRSSISISSSSSSSSSCNNFIRGPSRQHSQRIRGLIDISNIDVSDQRYHKELKRHKLSSSNEQTTNLVTDAAEKDVAVAKKELFTYYLKDKNNENSKLSKKRWISLFKMLTDHLTTHNQDVHTLIDKIHANSNNDMLGETISDFFLD